MQPPGRCAKGCGVLVSLPPPSCAGDARVCIRDSPNWEKISVVGQGAPSTRKLRLPCSANNPPSLRGPRRRRPGSDRRLRLACRRRLFRGMDAPSGQQIAPAGVTVVPPVGWASCLTQAGGWAGDGERACAHTLTRVPVHTHTHTHTHTDTLTLTRPQPACTCAAAGSGAAQRGASVWWRWWPSRDAKQGHDTPIHPRGHARLCAACGPVSSRVP